jgi:glycosyltransferase involved in cell wall biosynthesis
MRSLLVVHAVDGPGDPELALVHVAPLLLERGWRITMTGPTGRRPAEAPDGVAWRRQTVGGPGPRGALAALAAFGPFRALAAGHDVVLLNGAVPARLLGALRGTSVVSAAAVRADRLRRPADREPRSGPPPVRTVLLAHGPVGRVPAAWGHADALLADTRAAARAVGAALGREVVATGRPVDPDPVVVDPPWRRDARPVVAFVGDVEPRTAALDLVAAAERVRESVPHARIVVVGDEPPGADRGYGRLLDRRADAARVERWGRPASAAGLLRHVDVLVVPGHPGSFGTIAAQALALGVPVVASAVDGLVEVVRDGVCGRLVPLADPGALAHGVVWALRNAPMLAADCRAAATPWAPGAFADRLEAALRPVPPDASAAADGPPASVGTDAPGARGRGARGPGDGPA